MPPLPIGTDHWILLRGLTREARHWGEFPTLLGKVIPRASILALDTPGNGQLNQVESPTRVEAMMEYCRTALLERGIAPPYSLLSLSLGSMIATAWAHSHPLEVRRSVLINTSLRPFCPFYRRLRPKNYPSLIKQLIAGDARTMEAAILRITSSKDDDKVLDDWVRFRRENPVSTRNAIRQLFAAARYRAPVSAPSVPTLLLSGAADELVDRRCSHAIAERWQVPIRVHPTAGHDLPLDDAPWVAQQVAAWLDSQETLMDSNHAEHLIG